MSRRVADAFFGLVLTLGSGSLWAESQCNSDLVCIADELLRNGPSCWEECPCIMNIFRDSRPGARKGDEYCESQKIDADRYLSTATTSSGFATIEFLVSLDKVPRCPVVRAEDAAARSPFNIVRSDKLLAKITLWAGSETYDPFLLSDDEVIPRSLLKAHKKDNIGTSCVNRGRVIESGHSKYDRTVEACVTLGSSGDATLFDFWVAISETN